MWVGVRLRSELFECMRSYFVIYNLTIKHEFKFIAGGSAQCNIHIWTIIAFDNREERGE